MIRLFGTTTSPFVRRVRVVAAELDQRCELVDTATPSGQAELRARSPIWKVPAAEIDGRLVLDSHAIVELLLATHGPGPLRAYDPLDVETRNTIAVIDGALESLINVMYLGKDGVSPEQASYLTKQRERAAAAFAWLEQRVDAGDGVSLSPPGAGLGSAEIALVTAIGWVRFRETYPIDRHPALVRCFEHHDARPSFVATRPYA